MQRNAFLIGLLFQYIDTFLQLIDQLLGHVFIEGKIELTLF